MSDIARDEEYRVYEAVLNQKSYRSNRKLFVIKEEALAFSFSFDRNQTDEAKLLYWRLKLRSLAEATARDFICQNRKGGLIDAKLNPNLPCRLLSKAEQNELWDRPAAEPCRGQVLDGWKEFHERYPGAGGIIGFSRVGLNAEVNQALVEVSIQANWLMGHGQLLLLIREGEGWAVSGSVRLWVS